MNFSVKKLLFVSLLIGLLISNSISQAKQDNKHFTEDSLMLSKLNMKMNNNIINTIPKFTANKTNNAINTICNITIIIIL